MKPKLICIVGETASGKDCVTNEAIARITDYIIRPVCSYTDRPMRVNEVDGVEHYFVTTEEFNKLKKDRESDLLAYTCIKKENSPNSNGYQYMAFNDELYKSHIYIIDYLGLQDLRHRYGDTIDIVVVYIYAPLETRMNRAKIRSDFSTSFSNRVTAEEAQFQKFRSSKQYDYKLNNLDGVFDLTVNRLCNIIKYELIKNPVENMPFPTPKNK